jgi:hypothetical protein
MRILTGTGPDEKQLYVLNGSSLKRPLGFEDNIKMDVREIGWGGIDGLIWLRIGTSGGVL